MTFNLNRRRNHNVMLPDGLIKMVAVCVATMCSYISLEVHVMLRHRVHNYTTPTTWTCIIQKHKSDQFYSTSRLLSLHLKSATRHLFINLIICNFLNKSLVQKYFFKFNYRCVSFTDKHSITDCNTKDRLYISNTHNNCSSVAHRQCKQQST